MLRDSYCYLILSFSLFLYVFLVQLYQFQTGGQGLDFAIFTQAIDQVTKSGHPMSSLIDIHWQNFLTHHLSLYFYPLGWFNYFINNPALTLILFHSINAGFIIFLLLKISKHLNNNNINSILFVLLLFLHPSFRVPILWEAHDENFALTFLLAGFLFHLKDKHSTAILMLIAAMLFKETICFFAGYLALIAFIKSKKRAYLSVSFLGIAGLFLYFKYLPFRFFTPTFDGSERICNLLQLFELGLLKQKAIWIFYLLLPFLPLFIQKSLDYKKIILACFLIAAPFAGPIMISNFEPMFHLNNYYSFNPLVMLALSLLLTIKIDQKRTFLACLIAFCIQPQFINPLSVVKGLRISEDSVLAKIPKEATVLAGDFDASFFVQNKRVIRIYHANKNITHFDFIIYRKNPPLNKEKLSLFLRSWSEVCYEDEKWIIRCAKSRYKVADLSLL